ncbi:LOW QUALITY PROTEIN: keratin 99 [Colossoma macropomum]|uniref:LOW QUALITY PROTEIN: keratin 99 n=1 Tax=Colossoma macropomum TaxID=42526 RepID=UPI001863F995|nr:LOW QUALITY PROTEIN: keratin 99 [Colossoma macropomum]
MPVRVQRSSSFSAHSAVGSKLHDSAGSMVLNGLNGNLSVFESYGGYGSRISGSSSLVVTAYEVTFGANEKLTMQNLNNRLASYLEKVRALEAANRKIELQIREFYESRGPAYHKDLSGYFITIEDLRKQILARSKENAKLHLQLDNISLASGDFRMKFEMEMNIRLAVETDLARLRGTLGELQLACKDLEIQIPGLKEELVYLKKNHEEELHLLRTQQSGSVNVQVDCAPSVNLDKELQEMREQYETLIQKNLREAEHWFQSKAETLKSQVTSSYTEIKTSQTVLTDLKRNFQNLQIELDAALMQKQVLEKNLADAGLRYSAQITQLQLQIDHLQEELQELHVSIQQQATEYQLLLDIKMRLELEIAEYRRLLEGEARGSVVTSTVKETVTETVKIEEKVEEEHNPHVQRRVKVIVEELVDGKVVSTSVDEKIQELSN